VPQPPPSAQQQEQHQVPPYISQQHQYSDYELGMVATLYEQHILLSFANHFEP
ncbi:hypothetical protein A2U01_0113835, partial [Trifolium medium]|nr:hypothetical protein [Trifolium medium]